MGAEFYLQSCPTNGVLIIPLASEGLTVSARETCLLCAQFKPCLPTTFTLSAVNVFKHAQVHCSRGSQLASWN